MKAFGIIGFSDAEVVEGGDPARVRARAEQRRQQRLVAASALRRIPLEDLTFLRFGVVEHVPSGERFRVMRGEVTDVRYTAATAATANEDGSPVFLEPLT